MSEQHTDAAKEAKPSEGFKLTLRSPLIIALILIGFSLLAFGLTEWDFKRASWFWVFVVPVFATIGVWVSWPKLKKEHLTDWRAFRRQMYHWLALLVAIKIVFVLSTFNEDVVSAKASGLFAILLTAVSCFLFGVHFDWVFMPVGLLLAVCTLMAAFVDSILWLVLIAVAISIVVLLVVQWFSRKNA